MPQRTVKSAHQLHVIHMQLTDCMKTGLYNFSDKSKLTTVKLSQMTNKTTLVTSTYLLFV